MLGVRIPEELHRQLKIDAAASGKSMEEIVQRLIERHVKQTPKEKAT